MLAIEADVPGGPGAVPHFFAVGTYQLQHPARLRPAAAVQLWATVEDALAGKVGIPEILSQMRRRIPGRTSVVRKNSDPTIRDSALGVWPDAWPMTVADICSTDAAYYVEVVERWASTTADAIREYRRG